MVDRLGDSLSLCKGSEEVTPTDPGSNDKAVSLAI